MLNALATVMDGVIAMDTVTSTCFDMDSLNPGVAAVFNSNGPAYTVDEASCWMLLNGHAIACLPVSLLLHI